MGMPVSTEFQIFHAVRSLVFLSLHQDLQDSKSMVNLQIAFLLISMKLNHAQPLGNTQHVGFENGFAFFG